MLVVQLLVALHQSRVSVTSTMAFLLASAPRYEQGLSRKQPACKSLPKQALVCQQGRQPHYGSGCHRINSCRGKNTACEELNGTCGFAALQYLAQAKLLYGNTSCGRLFRFEW